MQLWEYCEVDFDGSVSRAWYYDESGEYIDRPIRHPRLGILLAILGHDGWEIISTFWRSKSEVTYMLKRPRLDSWGGNDREEAEQAYRKMHPKDKKFTD